VGTLTVLDLADGLEANAGHVRQLGPRQISCQTRSSQQRTEVGVARSSVCGATSPWCDLGGFAAQVRGPGRADEFGLLGVGPIADVGSRRGVWRFVRLRWFEQARGSSPVDRIDPGYRAKLAVGTPQEMPDCGRRQEQVAPICALVIAWAASASMAR
jgi:hypothetical protein